MNTSPIPPSTKSKYFKGWNPHPLASCAMAMVLAGFISPLHAANPLPGNFTQGIAATSGDSPAQVETIPLQVTTTQVSPPTITIETWVPGTFSIYRKDPSVNTWGTAVATGVALSANGTWADTNVTVGTVYEYRFVNTAATAYSNNYPSGYIICGIQADQTQPKGHIAVITASDVPVNLPAEYAQYKADLVDDGWIVNEIQVPRAVNYNGVGNGGIGSVKVNNGGTGSVTGDAVYLTNASGKKAFGTLTVSGSAITAVSIPAGACGAGFALNDPLTIVGGSNVGKGASLVGHVDTTNATLSYAYAILGGTGYTQGNAVTLTGQTSGKTAQVTLNVNAAKNNAISSFTITSSQTGFVLYEPLILSGNTTGTGIGNLFAYVPATGTTAGQVTYVYSYTTGSGYVQGDSGTLTGNTSGKTAQVTVSVFNGSGVVSYLNVVSSQTGFVGGETLTLSSTSTGSGAGLFTGTFYGPLQSITVNAGGSGYVNGNVVTINYGSTPAQGVLHVTGGAITSVSLNSSGAGFSDGGGLSLAGLQSNATGYNLTVNTLDNSDIGRAMVISAGGTGYSDNDTVTIKGNASGVTATGSIIAPSGTITGISAVLPSTFTAGESLTLTPTLGGTGAASSAGPSTSYHLLIRSAVQSLNAAYPGQLKNISIIGKVPVARSGLNDGAGSDGHGNECSYGTDAFYAEMNGVIGTDWTDTGDNTPNGAPLGDYNLPGDGQYDQQKIYQVNPAGVQLGFGRIDLSLGIQTEVEAERNYFNKLHRYKIADPSFLPGRYVCDRQSYANEREADLQAMPGVVGMQNIEFITPANLPAVQGGQDADQLYTTQNGPFLFYFKGSGGPQAGVNGKAVFWTGMQSHWGYWYQSNLVSSGANAMQLRLAENSFTLDFTWNIWGLRYIYHRMGMGFDAGDMLKQSINNQNSGANAGPYTYKFNNTSNGDYSGVLYMAQMGDPALRLFMFAPPTALSIVKTSGNSALNWTASTDGSVVGYHVYRAPYTNAPFTRLTTSPVVGTTYTDSSVTTGSYVYMVRAIHLETTGGGTYYNPSLGVTQSINLDAVATPVSITTNSIPGYFWNTAGSTTLVAQGGYPQYTWTITAGALPTGLTLSPLGVIAGTPTAIGSFNFTVKATDQTGLFATKALSLSVDSNTSNVIYPEATTYTAQGTPTNSYGTYEYTQIKGNSGGADESFHRYDLSGVNLYNGFQKATLYLYVTNGTTANAYAPIFANLIADSVDGWTANGISKFFTGYSNNGANKVRIACTNHGFATGTLVSVAGLTGTGAPTNGPYTVTNVDANDFDLNVTYAAGWAYDPALSYVTTASMTYNTRPTTYDTTVPTLLATGADTPGTWLQFDVTPYVQKVIKNNFANFPSKKMGLRFFTGTAQTVDLASLNAFGGSVPYLVIQTSNAPNITVNSPTQNPANITLGSIIYFNTTVTPIPANAANLTLQWSKVSGPGTVTFTNPTSLSTGASFSATGTYVVQLIANDGVATSFQNFTINVLTVAASGPVDSLVLRLPFDETLGTTAFDTSGVSPANNGTLTANPIANPLPTWTSTGKIGRDLTFAGNGQRVDVADSSTNLLDGMQKMSISMWIYANGLPVGSTTYAGLITKRVAAFNKESYNIQLRGSTAGTSSPIYLYIGGGTTLQSVTQVVTGKWYHVVAVFDGTQATNNLQLYVNGSPDKLTTIIPTTVPRNSTANLRIGAFDSSDTTGFNGMIDEVRIYNRPLTLPEIQDLAAATPSNLGPVITTNPSLSGTVGTPLTLSATVVDPMGGPLTYNWSQLSGPSTLTIANFSSISTTTTPNVAGTYGLQFLANDGIITTFANVTANIVGGLTYQQWLQANGLPPDGTGNGAPTATPLNDGVTNAMKYALGIGANVQGYGGRVATGKINVAGLDYLSVAYTIPEPPLAGVIYAVKTCSDLVSWTTADTLQMSGTVSNDGLTRTVTVRDTKPMADPEQKRFIRLEVTAP